MSPPIPREAAKAPPLKPAGLRASGAKRAGLQPFEGSSRRLPERNSPGFSPPHQLVAFSSLAYKKGGRKVPAPHESNNPSPVIVGPDRTAWPCRSPSDQLSKG